MRIKKRRKSSRYAGSQTHKRGHPSRTRGSGNQGGKGMAGTGKRGDQKKTLVINQTGGNNYFKRNIALRRGTIPKKLQVINLGDLTRRITLLLSQGKIKESKGLYELDFSGYKILGDGEFSTKVKIKADKVSSSAKEKIESLGGEIIIKESTKISKEIKKVKSS
jgi:large subunit ribosomal protein L15